jgi:hypothetical protein
MADPVAPARCRPFTLGDGMIVIAASAGWLALVPTWAEFLWGHIQALPFDTIHSLTGWWQYFTSRADVTGSMVMAASNVLVTFLMPFTCAFVLMRLRKPRPPMREVLAQPGMVAVEAMVFALGITLLIMTLTRPTMMGAVVWVATVPVSWIALKLAGHWRPEAGWIDRFGRALAVGWMLLLPAYVGLYAAFG